MSPAYQSASESIDASPSYTPTAQWTGTLGKKPTPPNSLGRTKGIADLEREMEELRASYQQVCEERDALEDLLLQEQLKNRTPADKQLEEAKAHAAALELELRSMAARCEEWKRRAAQRAAEMNPAMVQALLEERLEDLDESGTIKIQMEVARLRDELAKSEVLRFELFRSTQEGAGGHTWYEHGMSMEHGRSMVGAWYEHGMSMVGAWYEHGMSMEHGRSMVGAWYEHAWYEHGMSMVGAWYEHGMSMEEAEDLMQELLEMGQASLSQQDVERLSEAVEAAEHRAVEAERRAVQAEKEASEKAMQIRVLEAKLTALLGGEDTSAIASAPYHHQALSSSSSLSSRPLPSTSTTVKSNPATATSAPTQVPTTTNASASAATSSVHALANGITPRVSNTDDVAGGVRDVSRRRADVARESAGRRESVLVIGSEDGASAVGKGIGGVRGVGSEVESSAGESKGESAEESGGDSLKELAAAQIADVEEIREIVHRVQGQNRLTHLLLTVVFAASVPRVVDMVKNLLGSKQRPRYTRITTRAGRPETFGERFPA
ncbi:unnamed protein product [Closterium sp. Yama58-4]|nr:unnamed protein product [Closterium sp. Yama58-4]